MQTLETDDALQQILFAANEMGLAIAQYSILIQPFPSSWEKSTMYEKSK